MTEDDIDPVHQIDVQSFSLPWPRGAYAFDLLRNPAAHLWVAEQPGPDGETSIVGVLAVWLIVDELHISNLAVHPDHRRQGVARRLLLTAIGFGRDHDVASITLEVRESNLPARELYKSFGFKTVGRRVGYYQDNREDALLMTRNMV